MSSDPSPIDKHILYEASVQGTEVDIDLMDRVFHQANGRPPRTLREDFCGTALLACQWVQAGSDCEAWGVDLHRPTLDWGRKHRLSVLGDDAQRVHLLEKDVLTVQTPPVDVVAALNFSYMIFKERQTLKTYFQNVLDHLNPGGIFVLDLFGGPHAQDVMKESKSVDAGVDFKGTPHPAFTYVWEQAAFNAVNQNIRCHIHFKGKHIPRMKKAFTYEWRLWSITELTDLLHEVGFATVDPYLEGWDDEAETTDGKLEKRSTYEGMLAWISYLVAGKESA